MGVAAPLNGFSIEIGIIEKINTKITHGVKDNYAL